MVIDGKAISQLILVNLTKRVHALQQEYNTTPRLAVLRVGDEPSITSYINQKKKMAEAIGANVTVYEFPPEITEQTLLSSLSQVRETNNYHGIIVQLPLPKHINPDRIIQAVPAKMDVDGFHKDSPFPVPIAAATLSILERVYKEANTKDALTFSNWLQTKSIAVMGKGKAGGQPVIEMLRKLGCRVTVIDSQTQNASAIVKQSDIVISAVGKRGVIEKEMLKPGVTLIGIGMERGADGKFYGDYDAEDIKDVASFYTPIPGGVGPVNVTKLMENLVLAAEKSVK